MPKITVDEDCRNAPKKELIKQFLVAQASGDRDFILANVADDIRWVNVGNGLIEGKDNLSQALDAILEPEVSELRIATILSHGKQCAAEGVVTLAGGHLLAFCSMYTFSSHGKSAKIREINTYIIELHRTDGERRH